MSRAETFLGEFLPDYIRRNLTDQEQPFCMIPAGPPGKRIQALTEAVNLSRAIGSDASDPVLNDPDLARYPLQRWRSQYISAWASRAVCPEDGHWEGYVIIGRIIPPESELTQ